MATVGDILAQVAILLGRSNVSELTVNGFNFGLAGINQARQFAERQNDFKFSETNAYLSVASGGTSLEQAYNVIPTANTVTVTGSGATPDPTGTFNYAGQMNGLPFYTLDSGTDIFFLFYSVNSWFITQDTLNTTNAFMLLTGSTIPNGAYVAQGSFTGTATASAGPAALKVKRVKFVSLPIGNGDYQPVEFLSNDQFLSRIRMQIGRQAFNAVKNLSMLGGVGLVNPVAYQNDNTLYLSGGGITFPIIAQLNIVQWLADYVNNSDTDFFTIYGQEYLIWQTVLEINKKFKWLTVRQEGDVAEANAQAAATAALQTLIAWDAGIEDGNTEPRVAPNPIISATPTAQPS